MLKFNVFVKTHGKVRLPGPVKVVEYVLPGLPELGQVQEHVPVLRERDLQGQHLKSMNILVKRHLA